MQAANSEAKGAQRHAVLAANFEEHALASLRKYWTPYAELQRCKTDGWKGLQEQRRASGACGMG